MIQTPNAWKHFLQIYEDIDKSEREREKKKAKRKTRLRKLWETIVEKKLSSMVFVDSSLWRPYLAHVNPIDMAQEKK